MMNIQITLTKIFNKLDVLSQAIITSLKGKDFDMLVDSERKEEY